MAGRTRRTKPKAPRARATDAVAVVVSRYNGSVTDRLLEGARQSFIARRSGAAGFEIIAAPGSFELPALALAAAKTGRFAGIVAIGCLIKGETSHDRYIAAAVAHGLVNVTIATGIPVTFGVLTTDTPDQARARAGGEQGNKGADAMDALLDTLETIGALRGGSSPAGSSPRPDKAAGGGSR